MTLEVWENDDFLRMARLAGLRLGQPSLQMPGNYTERREL